MDFSNVLVGHGHVRMVCLHGGSFNSGEPIYRNFFRVDHYAVLNAIRISMDCYTLCCFNGTDNQNEKLRKNLTTKTE